MTAERIRDGFHLSKVAGGIASLLLALGVLPFTASVVGAILFVLAMDVVLT